LFIEIHGDEEAVGTASMHDVDFFTVDVVWEWAL